MALNNGYNTSLINEMLKKEQSKLTWYDFWGFGKPYIYPPMLYGNEILLTVSLR